jgi:[ribosomal protein S18]-alanine N-acetyltransferase
LRKHITLLAVDFPYRGQGLGQALLYALLRLARRRSLEWATLEVRLSNQTAIALYQKFGFERVGERRGYYQKSDQSSPDSSLNSSLDALILWRKGLQRPEFQDCLDQWRPEIDRRLAQSGWRLSEFSG